MYSVAIRLRRYVWGVVGYPAMATSSGNQRKLPRCATFSKATQRPDDCDDAATRQW